MATRPVKIASGPSLLRTADGVGSGWGAGRSVTVSPLIRSRRRRCRAHRVLLPGRLDVRRPLVRVYDGHGRLLGRWRTSVLSRRHLGGLRAMIAGAGRTRVNLRPAIVARGGAS